MGVIIHESGIKKSTLGAAKLSVVLITLNEELNLRQLLPQLPQDVELVIVDSGSVDQTSALAEQFRAKFVVRPFDNYSNQKNFAMSLATRPWILFLDADEQPDVTLWSGILEAVHQSEEALYELRRRLVFCGQKLKYGRTCDQVIRLFPKGGISYKNEIHEQPQNLKNLPVQYLQGTLWHHSYRSLSEYFVRFNRYTSLVAEDRIRRGKALPHPVALALRAPLDFLVRYGLKGGFLDGWYGFVWAFLGSVYGFIKYAKAIEMAEKPGLIESKSS